MKKILLVMACGVVPAVLAGGATVKVEVDDSREGYAIYCNGKKVCDDSRNCNVPVAGGDEMYFEAEKNGVVYGEAVIHRGDGGYSTQTILRKGTAEGATRSRSRRSGCRWALRPEHCCLWNTSPRLRNTSRRRS